MKVDVLPKQITMITILKIINILPFFLSLQCVFFKVSDVFKCISRCNDSALLHHCTFLNIGMITQTCFRQLLNICTGIRNSNTSHRTRECSDFDSKNAASSNV